MTPGNTTNTTTHITARWATYAMARDSTPKVPRRATHNNIYWVPHTATYRATLPATRSLVRGNPP